MPQSTAPFMTRLRERLSPRTWALEWVALALALLGMVSQLWPQLWPMSLRERLVTDGAVADATVEAVSRFDQRNQRWGTTKKIGATLPVYLLDLTWRDERGARQSITGMHVSKAEAAMLGLDRTFAAAAAGTEPVVRIRTLSLAGSGLIEADRRELADVHQPLSRAADNAPPCRPHHLCAHVLIDQLHTLDAKKFGDRPEANLTLVGLLVFAAMLAVRAIALVISG